MASSRRCWINHLDIFCYIWGSYTLNEQRKPISTLVKRAYFSVKIADQEKQWISHIACKTFGKHLSQWSNGKRPSLVSQWFVGNLKIITTIAISV